MPTTGLAGPLAVANRLKARAASAAVPVPPSAAREVRRLALANAVEHSAAARAGPILARLLSVHPELRSSARDLELEVRAQVDAVNAMSPTQREEELQTLGGAPPAGPRPTGRGAEELPPLPGAEPGRVVLRLAPFPSGALHIGNGRMIFVNDYYRRRYDGRLLLVFDDTIGTEDKRADPELFDTIREDLELAGAAPDAVYYKSDRIPRFYPWAVRVIERDAAYVCRCPAELLRENRKAGTACPERSEDRATTLAEWERMLGGEYGEGEAVLRLKTDLADPDPAFRDRVLFRISELDHPRVGRRYRVWPLLEFSWAVDDIELGITHVLRGKDLVIEDRMEERLWSLLGVRGPPFLHWGLLRVREAKLSKSKSYREVKGGIYDGWADPRTWSLRSLVRRGITMEALRRFTLSFGLSLADIEVPAETLYAENRPIIDPIAVRRAFVTDPIELHVEGLPPMPERLEMPNHPDRPETGSRPVYAGPTFWMARRDLADRAGEELRLKDLLNVRLPAEIPTEGTGPVRAAFVDRENRRLPRLQWVGSAFAVPVDLLDVDGSHRTGLGEAALARVAPGTLVQLERVGFARVEDDYSPGAEPVRLCYGHP